MLRKKIPLRLDRLRKADELFKEHKWAQHCERYANFCSLAGQMDDDEFNLLYELTNRFHLLEINNFIIEFLLGFYSSNDDLYKKSNHIYITAMKEVDVNGKHIKKSKSGDIVYDEFKANRNLCEYEDKFIFCKDASDVIVSFASNDLICFVDDFVGSGKPYNDTYKTFRTYFNSCGKRLEKKDIFAISAWAMEAGCDFCKSNRLRLFCNRKFAKEITEYPDYTVLERELKIKLMKKMEKRYVNNVGRFSLGYDQSEALISVFAKSPNNTFPIFWKAKNKLNIFPRFE